MKHKLLATLILITLIATCKTDLSKTVELKKSLIEQEIEIIEATKKTKTEATHTEDEIAKATTEKALERIMSSATAIKEEKSKRDQIERKRIEEKAKQLEVEYQKKWAQNQTQLEINKIKIAIRQQTQDAERLLIIKDNDYWNEPSDQFGMHDNNFLNKAFDILKKDLKPYHHDDNKKIREKIYLAFEYKDSYIRALGEILNKIAQDYESPKFNQANDKTSTKPQAKPLLQEIIENINEHSHHYFEIAFKISDEKQNKIDSLNLSDLKILASKFSELQKIRNTCKIYAKIIYNDFKNNKDEIRTGSIDKLEEYITNNSYRKKFKDTIEQIKILATQIDNIIYKSA
ncbi:hypothetical protein bcCo53_001127 (plasmid) [Borrelia coriaceae]|uniref:Putative membrane spanning protein n=1 Tax=Borrelia coriaceae ATCC 43381 TaxID=1408429 RepID=W5SVC8_9SPIR|nr:virulence associated lipoprotein [Borrelia coriaceae]AHH11169.1 Putative membrane spanning protein [Borrelia coriaceae ATCC 43381]UPA16959.1 hypothetical protein bcCo53_001127 [Borrelia coriaceae]